MCIVWTENVCWITFPKGLKFLPFDVVASTSRKLMRIFQSFIFYVNRLNLSNPMMRRLKARMTFLHEFSNLHFCHKKWKIDIYFLRKSYKIFNFNIFRENSSFFSCFWLRRLVGAQTNKQTKKRKFLVLRISVIKCINGINYIWAVLFWVK